MTLDELSQTLSPLEIEWPRSEFDRARLEIWHSHLKRFSPEQVAKAVYRWVGEEKYFPKVAEIRNLIDDEIQRQAPSPAQPRASLTELEQAWRCVQGAYANWITGRAINATGHKLMSADEVEKFVMLQKVPNGDTLFMHRVVFGELRRQFESVFGELPKAAGRTTHAFCGCARCEQEVSQFGVQA